MATSPQNTVTRLSHAVTIKVGNTVVGAINEWSPRMTQTVTELFELGVTTTGGAPGNGTVQYSQVSGEPYEKVPGNVSGMQIDVRRYDIYTAPMETAFGTPALSMLSNQRSAFVVNEAWIKPDGVPFYEQYSGCWFSNLGRTISSTGDRVVNVNATLEYTRRDTLYA